MVAIISTRSARQLLLHSMKLFNYFTFNETTITVLIPLPSLLQLRCGPTSDEVQALGSVQDLFECDEVRVLL